MLGLGRKIGRAILLGAGLLFVWLILWANQPLGSDAQTNLQWAVPQRIRGIADDADPPFLIADQNRTIHAFSTQWAGVPGRGDLAVFYSQWSPLRGWSAPVDVLLSPHAQQATVLGAFLDVRGMLHVIFFGGVAESAEIYYASAPAAIANQANAWSMPIKVGDHAGALMSGTIVGDAQGNLHIVYTGNGEGNGLYAVRSSDWGNTWSDVKPVFLTGSDSLWVYAIQATVDAATQVHVMWTVDNKAGNGDAVYYVRLESDHIRWSLPTAMQNRRDCSYEADWPSIVSYKNQILMVYNCGNPATRWIRRSTDGGRNWSSPTQPFALIGETGPMALAIDSNNVLHGVLANRTSDNRLYGLWHTTYNGDTWSAPKSITTGPRTNDFDPSRPRAVMSQGNTLAVVWRNDPGPDMTPMVWFSHAKVDAPELPEKPLPLPTPVSAVAANSTVTSTLERATTGPTRAVVVVPTSQFDSGAPTLGDNRPELGILVAVLPVLLLLVGLLVVRTRR